MIYTPHPIVQKLNELDYIFYPIGSRVYLPDNTFTSTDYDFLVAREKDDWSGANIGKSLEELGFERKTEGGYCPDSLLCAWYRYTGTSELPVPSVDVLIATEKEVQRRLAIYPQIPKKLYQTLRGSKSSWASFFKFLQDLS